MRHTPTALSLALAVALGLGVAPATELPPPATTRPDDEPATLPTADEIRLESLRTIAEAVRDLRGHAPARPIDLFTLRAEPAPADGGRGLLVLTNHPDTDGEVLVPLLGMRPAPEAATRPATRPEGLGISLAAFVVQRSPTALAEDPPTRFLFRTWRTDRPQIPFAQTEILFQYESGALQVVHDVEAVGYTLSVQLVQAPHLMGASPDSSDEALRLTARRIDRLTGEVTLDVRVAAPDFARLRHRFPDETSRYLRPILADIGHEAPLFAADARAAWQALAPTPDSDPAFDAKLKATLARLDADAFADRQAATAELKALGQPAALALRAMDRSALSFQQNSEVDAFLASLSPLTPADAEALASNLDFLLDCLELDERPLRLAAWRDRKSVV